MPEETASKKTVSDSHIELAVERIQEAIEKLTEVVVNRCSGSDEYSDEYRQKIYDSYSELLSMRDKLQNKQNKPIMMLL